MAIRSLPAVKAPAYRSGALALLLSTAIILAALGFEHLGGYPPCPLCLMQRYAYYAAIPLLFAALVLDTAEFHEAARLIFFVVGLCFSPMLASPSITRARNGNSGRAQAPARRHQSRFPPMPAGC